MAQLQLKWGNHDKLPISINESDIGCLYITKDEGSIYLGVEANKAPMRLQGVVQFYQSETDFLNAQKPPYSSEVIYYIANENALIRWDTEKKQFIQINVTAAEFKEVSDTQATHTRKIDSLLETASTHTSNIATLSEAQLQLAAAVDALNTLVGIGNNGNEGPTLQERILALEGSIGGIETNKNAIQQLTENKANASDLKTTNDNLTKVTEDLADTSKSLSQLNETVTNHIDKDFKSLTDTVGEQANSIQQINGKFDGYYDKDNIDTKIETINGNIEDLSDELEATKGRVTVLETWKTDIVDKAVTQVSTNERAISALDEKFKSYYTKTDADAEHQKLQNTINKNIQAANCLHYEGFIDSLTTLNQIKTNELSIGSTFVITTNISRQGQNTLYAGDLLIASGTEDETTGLISTDFDWVHVQSGYYDAHESILKLDDKKENILLASLGGQGSTKGSIQFSTEEDSNLNLNIDTDENNPSKINVQFQLQWGEFGSDE